MMMGFSGMWFWMIGMWFVFLLIAVFVFQDAEKRGRSDGILWFILLLIPWMNFLVLVIYLIVRDQNNLVPNTKLNVKAVLDNRYAQGEISREEYIQMREDLKGGFDQ